MHPLLQRQLKRLGLDPERCPTEADAWLAVLERISQSYTEGDQGRTLLEQSLDVTSREMQGLYEELQNSSETALSTEKGKLEAVLNSLADGLCVVDARWNILMMNPQAEALLQTPFAQLKGQPIYRLLSPSPEEFSQECLISDRSIPPLSPGIPYRTHDGTLLRSDRHMVPISLVVTQISHDGTANGAVLVFRDITEKKRAEAQQTESAALLHRVQAGLLELATNADIYRGQRAEAFRVITRVATQSLNVARASIWFFTKGRAAIRCANLYEQPTDRHSDGIELPATSFPEYFSALATEQVLAADQAQTDSRTSEFTASYLAPLGITSMLDVPLRVEGKMIGVICHEHIGPARQWTLEEEQFATSVANTVSLVLEAADRHEAEAVLRESEEKYRGLFESSSDAIMLLFPPEWTFTSCNPATVKLFGSNDAAHFTTLGPWDVSPERQADGARSSVKAQQAIETAMREGSHFFEWTHKNLDGHNFPAMVGLARITLQGRFGLQATVRDISEQKRAEHTLREQMQLSSLAADINSTLIQNATLQAMLQQCAGALIQHLDAAFARIWLLGPGDLCGACHKAAACANRTECLHLAASAGLSDNLNGEFRRVPLGALKIGKIAQGWGTMTTNDVVNDDRLPNKQWLMDHKLEAFAGYPLMVGTRVIGVMALFSRHVLSPLMLKTLERVSQVISLGVERKKTEEALRKSSAFQKAMLDNAGHAVISTTPEGIIRLFNPAAEALLGYSADELIGKQTPSLLHVPEEVATRARLFSAELGIELHPGFDVFVEKSRQNLPNEHEWTYIRKDGTRLTVLLNITALRDADGQISGFLGIASDITLLKIVERELISAKETAESASVAKSQFLANMSHEIRTPMNGVLGMAELLLNTPLTDKQRHLAENVHRSGTTLLGVINEILDFSKIEACKLELERLEFGLRETVEEAVDLFAESAGRKGLDLTCFLPDEIPDRAIGDPGRLRQVLLNLVGNAMKFTQRGKVTVWFHLLAQDAQTLTLKCAVTDTGIGIPPSAQAGLFTAFSQADGSTTRQFGGTGLGLAIVKQLVLLMGGEVGLTSAPGQGSTFWFTARLGHAAPGDNAQLENPRFLTGLRMLIVDADPTNLFVLNAPLTAWGAEVVSADSGAAALELLSRYANNRTPFDLALLDICMPGMDGLMLARAIKDDPAFLTVVLLAINSKESQVPGWQTESLGFIAWLQKPVRQSTLRDCLRRHLQGATTAPSTAGATALTPQYIDRRVLLAEDNPVNREVATGMLELLGYRVDSAEDGRQALERSETLPYDLILMDCQMPVMDGFAATAGIRERERQTHAAHIPIIALTANAMAQDQEQCLAAGMDDYLSKPFTQQQLKDLLDRWISQTSRSAPPEAPIVAPATASPNPSAPTIQPGQIQSASLVDCSAWEPIRMLKRPGHPDPLGKLLATYVEDSQTLIEQLRQAIASKDSTMLHALAHRLKSSSATLGALTLATHCKELEALGRERRVEEAPDRFLELERDFLAVCSIFQAAINKETSHER